MLLCGSCTLPANESAVLVCAVCGLVLGVVLHGCVALESLCAGRQLLCGLINYRAVSLCGNCGAAYLSDCLVITHGVLPLTGLA